MRSDGGVRFVLSHSCPNGALEWGTKSISGAMRCASLRGRSGWRWDLFLSDIGADCGGRAGSGAAEEPGALRTGADRGISRDWRCLFLRLDAQFAGFAQILVYIGAVAILVVFAILLTRGSDVAEGRSVQQDVAGWIWRLRLLCLRCLAGRCCRLCNGSRRDCNAAGHGATRSGKRLMGHYVLPLEIVAVSADSGDCWAR